VFTCLHLEDTPSSKEKKREEKKRKKKRKRKEKKKKRKKKRIKKRKENKKEKIKGNKTKNKTKQNKKRKQQKRKEKKRKGKKERKRKIYKCSSITVLVSSFNNCLIISKTVRMNMKGVHMSQNVFRVSQQLVYNTSFTTRSKYTE